MYTIENEYLKVEIEKRGAELGSIYSKKTQLDYLWDGDPTFWAKQSPVLFPIVGTLKNDSYYLDNKSYHLSRHGFAREMDFNLVAQTDTSVTLSLADDAVTREKYPFSFTLDIIYTIESGTLHTIYRITNKGNVNMYFSIGGHPAFKTPLEKGGSYDDYYLEFEKAENAQRWPVSKEGLIEAVPLPLLENTAMLPITRELFSKDAIILKHLNSESVHLKNKHSSYGIEFSFKGFPFLGLWAAPNADFVCIEPWCGIADSVTSDQQIINKEGINILAPGLIFERSWSVSVY